jgi:hypothetical protein
MMDAHIVLQAWDTPKFDGVLKQWIYSLEPEQLPLQQHLEHSSVACHDTITAMVLDSEESARTLNVYIGIFFSGILAGCSCADAPTPPDTVHEYCELTLVIDKSTGQAHW